MRLKKSLRQKVGLLRALPWGVLIPALLIALGGVAFIYSATTDFEMLAEGLATQRGFHVRQLAFLIVGVTAMVVVALLPPRWLSAHWYVWLGLGVALLLAVLVFGREINGAKRWIALAGGFNLQPSELCKPLMVMALAGYLRYHKSVDTFRTLGMCIAITGAFLVPILMQPDGGTAILFVPVAGAMIWVAGGNRVYMGILASLGAAVAPIAYLTGMLHDHQIKRVNTYLASLSGEVADPTGDGYQLMQSMTAVGSGGVTGKGFGMGSQSQLAFLPERHTDFIFCVVAEETGLIGVLVFMLILGFMLTRILNVARVTREPFSRLVVVGVAAMFFFQAAINLGVATGVVPVTGMTLPLVSYGGSSLLSAWLMLGLVANIAIQPVRTMGRATF
jgi:rod shape determining protein RodA